jgi:hypothetical protein
MTTRDDVLTRLAHYIKSSLSADFIQEPSSLDEYLAEYIRKEKPLHYITSGYKHLCIIECSCCRESHTLELTMEEDDLEELSLGYRLHDKEQGRSALRSKKFYNGNWCAALEKEQVGEFIWVLGKWVGEGGDRHQSR